MTDRHSNTSEPLDSPRTPGWIWPLLLVVLASIAALAPVPGIPPQLRWAALGIAAIGLLLIVFALRAQIGKARRALADFEIAPTAAVAMPVVAGPAKAASGLPELQSELERLRNAERELIAAKQAAEAAMMAKGEFLATMSHEIRTPLNGIIPLLDLVMSTQLAPDQREYVSTAFSSAKQLLSIVDDILDFSKLDANKLELENVGLNLKDIVDNVTRLMSRSAEGKGLKFSATIDPNVRLAGRGDPTRLRQVLTNLVSNSIKFTERGSIAVQVSKRQETRTHTELLFIVKDTGIGISADAQSKLFKEFSQADTSTTRTFGGTGLGLSICKRIVELMGGQIGVKSETGKGSIFWFTVPLGKALGDVTPGRSEIEGARAMLVSGDQTMQKRVNTLMTGWNMQCVQNNVSAEVISKIKSTSSGSFAFDFLILDFGSMRATALAILRGVLRESSLESLRVICISGDDQLPDEVRMAPQSAIVQRNFADMELRTAMQALLSAPRSAEPTPMLNAVIDSRPAVAGNLVSSDRAPTAVGGHVLLVEDNPVNRQVAQRLLTLIGVSFETAENGKEGVGKAATGQFDAVLMDCQMPIMDGYTATRAMRKLQSEGALGKLPIIAMTANAMVGDREKCLSSGMDDYMSKPLNRSMIEQMLRKWLPPGATSRVSAASAPAAPVAAAPARPMPQLPTSTRGEGAAIDLSVVRDLMDLMGSDFNDLVRVYLEDTPKNLGALDRAAKANDVDALVAPAHSMKSTSANLGALLLADMAKRIEQGARSGDIGDPVLLVAQLQNEFQRASAQLRQMIGA